MKYIKPYRITSIYKQKNDNTKLHISSCQPYPQSMSGPDPTWSQLLANAIETARSSGRNDVADYLTLRASNDEVRTAGVSALFDAVGAVAAEKSEQGIKIAFSLNNSHNFQYRNANIPGSRAEYRIGVRCLMIEAGWTRTPSDGFMRGGALAVARLTHFGIKKANIELILTKSTGSFAWMQADEGRVIRMFGHDDIRSHIDLLIG